MVRYVALGKESSFGAEASPTRYIDLARETLTQRHDWIIPELASARWPKYALKGPIRVEGSLDCYVRPGTVGDLLYMALGEVSTSQPDPDNAPNTYDHEFTPSSDGLPSYTVEVGTEVAGRRFTGCVVRRLELTCAAGELLGVSVDFLGKEEKVVSPAEPSWDDSPFFSFADLKDFKIGDATVWPRAFTLRIENDLVDDYYTLGDRAYRELPVRGFNVEGSFDLKFSNTDQLGRFLAGEEASLLIFFQKGEVEAGFPWWLEVKLPRIVYTAAGANVDRRELLVEGVEFRALYDESAGYVVWVKLRNKVSGY